MGGQVSDQAMEKAVVAEQLSRLSMECKLKGQTIQTLEAQVQSLREELVAEKKKVLRLQQTQDKVSISSTSDTVSAIELHPNLNDYRAKNQRYNYISSWKAGAEKSAQNSSLHRLLFTPSPSTSNDNQDSEDGEVKSVSENDFVLETEVESLKTELRQSKEMIIRLTRDVYNFSKMHQVSMKDQQGLIKATIDIMKTPSGSDSNTRKNETTPYLSNYDSARPNGLRRNSKPSLTLPTSNVVLSRAGKCDSLRFAAENNIKLAERALSDLHQQLQVQRDLTATLCELATGNQLELRSKPHLPNLTLPFATCFSTPPSQF